MILISTVKKVEAYKFSSNGGDKVLINADGIVNTSGWSGIKLSPRFYSMPPADGIWELDFNGDPPIDMALQVQLTVSAYTILGAPDWLKGFKVYAENGELATTSIVAQSLVKQSRASNLTLLTRQASRAIFQQQIASYDDSFNPIGFCSGFGSIKMKKLRHELTLVIEGPDDNRIKSCVEEAIGVGLIAAIIAVYATGGGGLSAAVSAFLSHIKGCLGSDFEVRLDDSSYWIEWCT